MIVVAIIALLAVVAMPSFLRARERSQNSKFMNALRVATDAIELYASENPGRYPADQMPGVVPPELASYLDATLDWTARTPIGGQWDWDFNVFSVKAAVAVVGPNASIERMREIDTQFDDGDLTTGRFRTIVGGHYSCVIEN